MEELKICEENQSCDLNINKFLYYNNQIGLDNFSFNYLNLKDFIFKEIPLRNLKKSNFGNHQKLFLIYLGNKLCILSLNESNTYEITHIFDIMPITINSFFSSIFCFFFNKIYLIQGISSVLMIDTELNQIFKIEDSIDDLTDIELTRHFSYCFYDTKFIITGGINEKNKVGNRFLTYDISTYSFRNEKVKENNLIPRCKHSTIEIGGYIYVIGGFTKAEECEENVCNKIQVIKYDTYMNSWIDLNYQGAKPELLVCPISKVINENFLIVFSEYKFYKLWCLDLITNNSKMIKLSPYMFPLYKTCLDFILDEKKMIEIYYLSEEGQSQKVKSVKIKADFN
jgi:hypothetical protein